MTRKPEKRKGLEMAKKNVAASRTGKKNKGKSSSGELGFRAEVALDGKTIGSYKVNIRPEQMEQVLQHPLVRFIMFRHHGVGTALAEALGIGVKEGKKKD